MSDKIFFVLGIQLVTHPVAIAPGKSIVVADGIILVCRRVVIRACTQRMEQRTIRKVRSPEHGPSRAHRASPVPTKLIGSNATDKVSFGERKCEIRIDLIETRNLTIATARLIAERRLIHQQIPIRNFIEGKRVTDPATQDKGRTIEHPTRCAHIPRPLRFKTEKARKATEARILKLGAYIRTPRRRKSIITRISIELKPDNTGALVSMVVPVDTEALQRYTRNSAPSCDLSRYS